MPIWQLVLLCMTSMQAIVNYPIGTIIQWSFPTMGMRRSEICRIEIDNDGTWNLYAADLPNQSPIREFKIPYGMLQYCIIVSRPGDTL